MNPGTKVLSLVSMPWMRSYHHMKRCLLIKLVMLIFLTALRAEQKCIEPAVKSEQQTGQVTCRYAMTSRHLNAFGLTEESCGPEIKGGYMKYGMKFSDEERLHFEEADDGIVLIFTANPSQQEFLAAITLLIAKGYRITAPQE